MGFLVCLIHLIFTVDNYILKGKNNNNVSPVTTAIFYSFLNTISLYLIVMLIILLYFTANLKEINLFVNKGKLR